jgi:hypothetical protein
MILNRSQSSLPSITAPYQPPSVEELEWSDDEEQDEKKQFEKYKLPGINPHSKQPVDDSKEKRNKLLIERQEMIEEPLISSVDRLSDHKRSFFNGSLVIKEEKRRFFVQKQTELIEKLQKKTKSLPYIGSSSSSTIPASHPVVSKELYFYFSHDFFEILWKQCLNLLPSADVMLGLIPVNKLLLKLLKWLDNELDPIFTAVDGEKEEKEKAGDERVKEKPTRRKKPQVLYNYILSSYELNDFISFQSLVEILQQHYYLKDLGIPLKFKTSSSSSSSSSSSTFSTAASSLSLPNDFRGDPYSIEDEKEKNLSLTVSLPLHCCNHRSCRICTTNPLVGVGNQTHVIHRSELENNNKKKKKRNSSAKERKAVQVGGAHTDLDEVEEKEEAEEEEEEEEEEVEEEESFTKDELYRIETIYRKYHFLFSGKLTKKIIFEMIQECLIHFDRKKIPKNFWTLSSELLLNSVEEFKEYIKLLRKDIIINEQEVLIDSILKYPLPSWLKMEFKMSEILLYQHLFSLIDVDGGGSIDGKELQGLFSSIGSSISLEEV